MSFIYLSYFNYKIVIIHYNKNINLNIKASINIIKEFINFEFDYI